MEVHNEGTEEVDAEHDEKEDPPIWFMLWGAIKLFGVIFASSTWVTDLETSQTSAAVKFLSKL